jgi:hypothetical protein
LLADPHYSRQTPGAREFMPPGKTFVLLSSDSRAVWGAVENVFNGRTYWRVSIFRNTGARLSSLLIRRATRLTRAYWRTRHGTRCALRTEVDPAAVRRKRDPGRCFLRAGWRCVGPSAKGDLLVFEAP